MRIETKRLTELAPADYNPRLDLKPGDAEYEKIKRSIQEFGMVDPIIWNEKTGTIVGGHQRYKVLLDLGYEEVEVSVVSLTPEKEKALNIALNKIGGGFDDKKLYELLEDLDSYGFDVTLTGFDGDELAEILGTADFQDELEKESHYTDKIKAPNYEPKELTAPELTDLYNNDRMHFLLYDIEKSGLDENVKDFLRLAAYRHVVFDYSKIAEYYAHAPAEVQELMEQSALVIIDYNKAIQYGFTELASVTLENEFGEEGEVDEEEA